jgi:hypothetical protein
MSATSRSAAQCSRSASPATLTAPLPVARRANPHRIALKWLQLSDPRQARALIGRGMRVGSPLLALRGAMLHETLSCFRAAPGSMGALFCSTSNSASWTQIRRATASSLVLSMPVRLVASSFDRINVAAVCFPCLWQANS